MRADVAVLGRPTAEQWLLVRSSGRAPGRQVERDLLTASADRPIHGRCDAVERCSEQPLLAPRPNGLEQ
jgi:hypothetical protein